MYQAIWNLNILLISQKIILFTGQYFVVANALGSIKAKPSRGSVMIKKHTRKEIVI